jgi:hypothetical protein
MAPCLAPLWILIDEYIGFFGMKKACIITCDFYVLGKSLTSQFIKIYISNNLDTPWRATHMFISLKGKTWTII